MIHSFKSILELLKPNPRYTKTPLERRILENRNKAVFFMCIGFIFIFTLELFLTKGPRFGILMKIMTCSVVILSLFIACRSHPDVFNTCYNLTCFAFGLSSMSAGSEGMATTFIFVGILPLFTQVVTGSYVHYVIQLTAQIFLLNTYYQKPLEELISSNTPSMVVKYLTYASNSLLIIQALLVVLIDRFLLQARGEAHTLEQKKNEAESQRIFLLGFSHELRNLINSLTGNVKLATAEKLTDRARDLLCNAEVCGEMLLHLINNILDSGKAEINELEINPVPTKTYDTFERIWGICSELIIRKDLGGSMKIPKNLPRSLLIDHHRLTQIFLNLVGNSIKFTDKGSIDITVDWIGEKEVIDEKCFQPYPFNSQDEHDEGLFEKQMSFSCLREDFFTLNKIHRGMNKVLLRPAQYTRKGILKMIVSDKGCGMTEEQLSRLFQKFTQVTQDPSKKKLGTGLGLFITKQLCQRMKGEIRAYSKPGRGASFIFCIPAKVIEEDNQVLADQESVKRQLVSKNLKAMIVDDAPANHFILGAYFENLSVQVTEIAVNGLEAFKKYTMTRRYPDIVAMDLDMPIMNGKLASEKIREFEKEKRLKPCFLMIISGNCIDSEINECIDKGGKIRADVFLRKPVRAEDLTRVIAYHFRV